MLHGRSDSLGQLAIIAARSLRLLLAAWKPSSSESVGGSARPPFLVFLLPFSPSRLPSRVRLSLRVCTFRLSSLSLSLSLFSRGCCVVPRFLQMCLLRLCWFSAAVSVVCLWCLGSGFYLALFCALCDDFGPFWGAVVFPLSLSLSLSPFLSLSLFLFLCFFAVLFQRMSHGLYCLWILIRVWLGLPCVFVLFREVLVSCVCDCSWMQWWQAQLPWWCRSCCFFLSLSLCRFLWLRGLGLSVFYLQALLRFSVSDHCLSICFCFWHFLSRGLWLVL